MNAIDECFRRLRAQKRKAFIPFITAGDPSLDATVLLLHELARRGAGLIEVGFPYSNPIADGSVIQASYTRALDAGLQINDIFRTVSEVVAQEPFAGGNIPLVCMVSYSLVHHRGAKSFFAEAQAAGFSGAIIPDLPVEEADEASRLATARDFKLIHLVTPTTPRERVLRIARSSTGFLYVVSVTGITGERTQLPAELLEQLNWLRTQTDLPLCVGFGISTPEHVRMLKEHVDGIIVGSALVRLLEGAVKKAMPAVIGDVGNLVQGLADALS